MIVLARIDHRLLHGQVVYGWVRQRGVERIVIADDVAAADQIMAMALGMAKPADCGLDVVGMDRVRATLDAHGQERCMVIVRGVAEACELVRRVPEIGELNVGGVPSRPGAAEFGRAVFLTPEEVEALKGLEGRGVRLFVQMTPTSPVERDSFA